MGWIDLSKIAPTDPIQRDEYLSHLARNLGAYFKTQTPSDVWSNHSTEGTNVVSAGRDFAKILTGGSPKVLTGPEFEEAVLRIARETKLSYPTRCDPEITSPQIGTGKYPAKDDDVGIVDPCSSC